MMESNEARAVLAAAVKRVAPEVDLDTVPVHADLREEAGLDSMDFLNVVTAIHEATGIEIPERDYPRLATLAGFLDYLVAGGG